MGSFFSLEFCFLLWSLGTGLRKSPAGLGCLCLCLRVMGWIGEQERYLGFSLMIRHVVGFKMDSDFH